MKSWWQDQWEKQSARLDAMSLRERVFLFLSVMACAVALADVLWLSPAQAVHKQLTQRFEKQSTELQRLRDTLKTAGNPVATGQPVQAEIAGVKSRLDALNRNLKELVPTTAQVTPLAQVLVPLLRRHEGLTLVRTDAVAAEAPAKVAATGGPGAGPSATPPGLSRQGVELTVSGPYAELTRYVETLEQALPYVRWGAMKLKSDKLPLELTLQLFLVGVP